MGFGGLRSIVRPLLTRTLTTKLKPPQASTLVPLPQFLIIPNRPLTSIFSQPNRFDRLTDTRLPKRRPLDKPRRKRASLRPPGPYTWVKHVAGEPIQPNNPNQGSVKRRNEKKRIKLHHAFIKAEAKKRKAQLQEAKRKKMLKRVERKMAAVAREREWTQRLAELQRLEEEKKQSMAVKKSPVSSNKMVKEDHDIKPGDGEF